MPRPDRAPLWAGLAAVVLMVGVGCADTDRSVTPPGPIRFGTLQSDLIHLYQERAAGVGAATLELSWRDVEPQQGRFNDELLQRFSQACAEVLASGRTLTLGLGVHETPDWVVSHPGARYVDQHGAQSPDANVIFSGWVRERVTDYLRRVGLAVDLTKVSAIRVTSGGSLEMLYPDGGGYWAFDTQALSGIGLAEGMTVNPLPNWRPGTSDIGPGPAAIRRWLDWYLRGLVNVTVWQRDLLGELGFHGSLYLLTPGVGFLPVDLDEAVARGLPDGLLGTGAAWAHYYAALPRDDAFVAYSTSIADGSGRDSVCATRDDQVPLTSADTRQWSAIRWIARLANHHRLPLAGENPGLGMPAEHVRSYRESGPGGMMATAFRQVIGCRVGTFYWAHDAQLWNNVVPFEVFAAHIAAAQRQVATKSAPASSGVDS